ncbi:MAG: membrane protein insertase YidC [Bilophila sp.]
MQDKRTFIAICLSIAILLGWAPLAEHMGWMQPQKQPVPQEVSAPHADATGNVAGTASTAPATSAQLPVFVPSAGRDVKVETPLYSAVIHTGGGVLRSFTLKQYTVAIGNSPDINLVSPEAARTAPLGLTVNGQPSWSTGAWSFEGTDLNLAAGQQGSLTFTGVVDGIRVSRVITFNADSYLLSEKMLVSSTDQTPRSARFGFMVAATPFSNGEYDPTRLAWLNGTSFKEETSASTLQETGIIEQGSFGWAGVMSNYFMNVAAPGDTQGLTLKGRVQGTVWRVALERQDLIVPSNGEAPVAVNWWFGPKDRSLLNLAPNNLSAAVDFGMFSIISRPLLVVLNFFYNYVGNWGIAILLLTLCIRIVFWPLSQKSYKSMEQMKKLQPMMKKLREKYADDKQALNREVMQLYKTYKVNPAGGCLPIVVQIPVFIGLYQALLNSIELRHASFIEYLPFTKIVWLADLSAADPFYISPLLMGASMFVQQRLTPAAGDPTQQKVMMFMPLIFTVMFLNFPAGLVLYWLCNNILSIGQQWWMLRKA